MAPPFTAPHLLDAPCEQNESQTGVKTLPCPKVRLRAVISKNNPDILIRKYNDQLESNV